MSAQNIPQGQVRQGETLVFQKTPTLTDVITHYCPGCHHGIAHRLVAEVLDELDLAANTIGVASVGCSAFIYNYFDLDFIEAPHGRACAVATGVKRARPDQTVFTYQGDGDLAAIGMAESIHAANRGENITVLFINNTVYGMTGGQMAPTSMPGQKTTTSPAGRNVLIEGEPFKMAELMSGLNGVAYSARCSLDSVKHVNGAKRSIKKAFELQQAKRGFSFVELLCGCPTNMRMDPLTCNMHLRDTMIPYFPLGVYKDITKERV